MSSINQIVGSFYAVKNYQAVQNKQLALQKASMDMQVEQTNALLSSLKDYSPQNLGQNIDVRI